MSPRLSVSSRRISKVVLAAMPSAAIAAAASGTSPSSPRRGRSTRSASIVTTGASRRFKYPAAPTENGVIR